MKTIEFAGYVWELKNGFHGPGPNYWSDELVSIQDDCLCLRTEYIKGKWYSSQVRTIKKFNKGKFKFSISSMSLDPVSVLGLFVYSKNYEVDVEFCQIWKEGKNCHRTIWENGEKRFSRSSYQTIPARLSLESSQNNIPFYINLWNFRGKTPKTVSEAVISFFDYAII